MFTSNHFYHRIIRKNVVAFGNLFKNITLVKYNIDNTEEHGRQTVPLSYSGKENFVSRLFAEPELAKATQIQLPRMSFEMTSLSYDSTRKLSKFNTNTKANAGNSNTVSRVYGPVPYNMGFELNLYVRNVEDGTQIIEQILPFFSPDYVVTMNYLDGYNIAIDVPITLDTVDYTPQYEGPETTTRILIWTLTFTVKTFFFASENTNVKVIKKSTVNTHIYSSNTTSSNTKVTSTTVVPDPTTADIDDDYGFTTTTQYYPFPPIINTVTTDSSSITTDSSTVTADGGS